MTEDANQDDDGEIERPLFNGQPVFKGVERKAGYEKDE